MNVSNPLIWVEAFGQTDVGLVRENNEDSFRVVNLTGGTSSPDTPELKQAIGERGCLLVVADGMGGVEGGEVASRMAVESMAKYLLEQLSHQPLVDQHTFVTALGESVVEANTSVFHEGQRNNRLSGMGTTLTAAAVHRESIYFAQLGDSRAYLVRNDVISQMTRDQSLVSQLIASGALSPEKAKTHPQRNVLLQALGVQRQVDIVISFSNLKRGDQLVLCSDGLSGKVEPAEIKNALAERPEPKAACQRLVQLARDKGGEDNITVIVARFDGDGLSLPGPDDAPVYESFTVNTKESFQPRGNS